MATAITPWLKSINESTCTLKSLLSRNSLERWKSTKNVRARFPNLLHLLYFHQLRPLQLPLSLSSVYPLSPPPLSSLHGSRPYAFRPPMSSMTTTDASSNPSTNKTVSPFSLSRSKFSPSKIFSLNSFCLLYRLGFR